MIGIHYPEEQKIFCPACGIMTFSFGEDWLIDSGAELVMNDCSHLQFLGTDDGKEIDKNYWYDEHREVDADVDFLDYLKNLETHPLILDDLNLVLNPVSFSLILYTL